MIEIVLIILMVILLILALIIMKKVSTKEENIDVSQILKQTFSEKRVQEINDLNKVKDDVIFNLDNKIENFNKRMETRFTDSQNIMNNQFDKLNIGQKDQLKDLSNFKDSFSKSLKEDFEKLNKMTEERLIGINKKVDETLKEGFEKTHQSFADMVERLAKIDEAQKKIESLSTDIVGLQDVLTDKKSRGIFGEVQLNQILEAVFGLKKQLYGTQVKLSNGTMVDAMINAPEPLGNICIDSKFPLENYRRMVDRNLTEPERNQATKDFKGDIKKHIDAISSKYIILNETAGQAMMFLPAEAIFAEINAYHPDLIETARDKKVWIVSPTTLMSTLSTIQVVMRDMERNKHAKVIQDNLTKLAEEFKRFVPRWNALKTSVNSLSGKVKEFDTTTGKITSQFNKIVEVEFTETETIEYNEE